MSTNDDTPTGAGMSTGHHISTGDPPTGDPPTGDPLTGDNPTGDNPTGDNPTGDTLTGDTPTGDTPIGDPPAGDGMPTGDRTSTGDIPVRPSMSTGDGAADAAPPMQERIRYVEVSPTGWPTMAKAVRDLDVEKVQDYKEDIDTLLVFAGLFSAVLSAFLLVAYTFLSPDSNGQMVYLLERIAAQTQSYTLVAGHLNTTALPQDPPSTAIPGWAVQVNALWFASLIISLSVASYGMLVKQWLREYLAMEYTAPQERLRARQYRRPSLANWKVFEIASALPILLQLSLGLFFIGICIFTKSFNNNEIAHLILPLVCAWAVFFIFAALAPLMSPRCPYKTPFLKGILKRGRMLVILPTLFVLTHISHRFERLKSDTSRILHLACCQQS